MARKQITREPEVQRRVRRRAGDLGVSPAKTDPAFVFDLGKSRRSDIAMEKDAMIVAAFAAGNLR